MKKILLVIILLLVAWLAYSCIVPVDVTQYAVIKRFGDPRRVIREPGPHIKWPAPIETVVYLDRRLLVFEQPRPSMPFKEYLTRDPKNVEIASYTAWRIGDDEQSILRFLKTVRDRQGAEDALGDIIVAELGAVLGNNELAALINTNPENYRLPEIVAEIHNACRERAAASYGIDLVDFRLTRLNFPPQNRRSVFDRMRAERQQIATRYRAEGEEAALKIRAEAERQRDQILSEAYRDAERIRGQADAEVTTIYGEAYGQDPKFYEFLRTLETYETALTKRTTAVLSSDSWLFRLLTEFGGPEQAADVPPTREPQEGYVATTRPADE